MRDMKRVGLARGGAVKKLEREEWKAKCYLDILCEGKISIFHKKGKIM